MSRPSNPLRSEAPEAALDRIDFALLGRLQNDARASNKELAASVGLAPSSCLARVRRLDRAVVRGYHADLDPLAIGLEVQAMIAVRLRVHSREAFESFDAHLRAMPEVVDSYAIGGEIDFLVHVAVADVRALQDLTREGFTTRDEVAHITTSLVFEHRRHGLPLPASGDPAPAGRSARSRRAVRGGLE